MTLVSVNPATGQQVLSVDEHSDEEVERRLERASEAAGTLRASSPADRAEALTRVAARLEERTDEWARLAVSEMGKTFVAARAELAKCAATCRHYAEVGPRLLRDAPIATPAHASFVRPLPLGIVLAVMPWNFPFWQVIRFAAPSFMVGNAALLKHASNVPGCALALEALFEGLTPAEHAFQTLLVGSKRVGGLLEDDRIAAVTLTGSERAGASVAARAGETLKKSVLELGGSDPFIVLPSADVRAAADAAVESRHLNNGQSCIAAKRFIVHADVYDAFEARFLERLRSLKVGDPLDQATDVGPLVSEEARETLEGQLEDALEEGAVLLAGGKRRDGEGFFFEPTAVRDVPRSARIFTEEVFGPIAALYRVGSADEALELANATSYGLGSSVWTRDVVERERFVGGLESGYTAVNTIVASDPRLPFGGVKRSGYGRELGTEGLFAFANLKTVVIER